MDTIERNPRAVIGGNKPPLTPYEQAEKAINDLYEEAKLWMDGAAIESQDLADGVSNLKATILKARKEADGAREADKKPHLDAGRAVDAQYKPLIEKADRAMDACKRALAPWLKKLADEQERKAAEARAKADAERKAAEEALRAADASNLAEREAAEAKLKDANKAEADAKRAENTKALAGGSVGRRDGLITVYRAEMIDRREALKHFAATRPDDLVTWLQGMADSHVRVGQHTPGELPGFLIKSEQVVR